MMALEAADGEDNHKATSDYICLPCRTDLTNQKVYLRIGCVRSTLFYDHAERNCGLFSI